MNISGYLVAFIPYMQTKSNKLHKYLKWVLWVVLAQVILVNISASIYAYRFTHFYEGPPPVRKEVNLFSRTWKLFTGPKFYKRKEQQLPVFPHTTVRIPTRTNASLEAWYSAHDSAKACVILFHGLGMNKSFVVAEAARFRDWGYNVLLVDFRAHGGSSGNNTTLGIDETTDIAKAFQYAQSLGNQKIILYGVSLGAVAALKAVAENKVTPAAIIAELPFDNLHNHFKARARDVGFPAEPFASLVTAWTGIENGFNGFNHDAAAYARDVKCPVLVQYGEQDRFVSREAILSVYNNLGSAQKALAGYKHADHESLVQVDEVKWQQEVLQFLGNIN